MYLYASRRPADLSQPPQPARGLGSGDLCSLFNRSQAFSGPPVPMASRTRSNNNNSGGASAERSSSIKMCKPPGGGSTMGSIIFGGSGDDDKAFVEDRKSRRLYPQSATPEQGVLPSHKSAAAGDASMYGAPTSSQRERERITVAPGAVALEDLRQLQQQQPSYPQHHHQSRNPICDDDNNSSSQQLVTRRSSTSDYFANGMGNADGGNQQRRTRRMVAAPGSGSNFQLG
jgi:hypothetical protein